MRTWLARCQRPVMMPIFLLLLSGVFPGVRTPFLKTARAQRHPPEVRSIYPLGGSPDAATRVTISGMSFREASQILWDKPGIRARIQPADTSKLVAPTLESDGNPNVIAEFAVAPDAMPGIYKFRVVSPSGVSSEGQWAVGRKLPTVEEIEPNNESAQAQKVTLPVAINGHISEIGDQDTFAVTLEAGKTFVGEVTASAVGSPLDSRLILRDANGQEVAENDDYDGPDPVLIFSVPRSGRYFLTIDSAVGGGGANYAYRLSAGYLPRLEAVYPPGIEAGKTVALQLMGVNVSGTASYAAPSSVTKTAPFLLDTPQGQANPVPIAVSTYPTVNEIEPNDTPQTATKMSVPGVACGRFYRANNNSGADSDYFTFHAKVGQRLLIDAQCAAIGSHADPMLTLYDSKGKMLQENDDFNGRDSHLDYVSVQEGDYVLRVRETQGRTGPAMVYRVVVQTLPPPGFSLYAETRGRTIGQGDVLALEVSVRRDRYDGPITLTVEDLPKGVLAEPAMIPTGTNRTLLVLNAASNAALGPFPLHIVGTGEQNGSPLRRALDRAADWIWNGGGRTTVEIMPTAAWLAVVPPFEVAPYIVEKEASVARGQSVKIKVRVVRRSGTARALPLRVLGAPDGVEVPEVSLPADKQEIELEIKAGAQAPLGMFPIVVTAMASNGIPNLELERPAPAILLKIQEAPKKQANARE